RRSAAVADLRRVRRAAQVLGDPVGGVADGGGSVGDREVVLVPLRHLVSARNAGRRERSEVGRILIVVGRVRDALVGALYGAGMGREGKRQHSKRADAPGSGTSQAGTLQWQHAGGSLRA